jgi:hypothetical protein
LLIAVPFNVTPGVTFAGYDMPGQPDGCFADLANAEQFAALCAAMPGCRVFLFKEPTATAGVCAGGCWLESDWNATLQNETSMVAGSLEEQGAWRHMYCSFDECMSWL